MAAGTSTAGIGSLKVFSTKRACPQCGTSYPELDPRMFSYNSKHGWCTSCVGTGLTLTREQRKALDDSVATTTTRAASRASRPTSPRWKAWRRALPRLPGRAAEPDLAQRSASTATPSPQWPAGR
jgi:excinuclease UvrABC ATPase subunit